MPEEIAVWIVEGARAARDHRSGAFAAGFAMDLGYANISRLKKACMAAHQISLDEMEFRIVTKLVQKFFSEFQPSETDDIGDEAESTETTERTGTLSASRSSQRIKLPTQTPPYKEGGEKRPEAV
jgi:hypothetical protein